MAISKIIEKYYLKKIYLCYYFYIYMIRSVYEFYFKEVIYIAEAVAIVLVSSITNSSRDYSFNNIN